MLSFEVAYIWTIYIKQKPIETNYDSPKKGVSGQQISLKQYYYLFPRDGGIMQYSITVLTVF